MKKPTLLVVVTLLLATISHAQDYKRPTGSEFSFGIEGALPIHGWKVYDGKRVLNYSKLGGGVTIKYAYNFNETVAVTFQTGYIYFPGRTIYFDDGTLGSIKVNLGQLPLKAGVRFSRGPFYIEPQLGVSSINTKLNSSGLYNTSSSTAFTYSIGIGAMAAKNFDYTLHYEAMSKGGTTGYLALRFAYSIPFSK